MRHCHLRPSQESGAVEAETSVEAGTGGEVTPPEDVSPGSTRYTGHTAAARQHSSYSPLVISIVRITHSTHSFFSDRRLLPDEGTPGSLFPGTVFRKVHGPRAAGLHLRKVNPRLQVSSS